MEKIYKQLGYYYSLNDIIRLYDKTAEYVVEEMLKDNGCFAEVTDNELPKESLDRFNATYVKVDGKEYAVLVDNDWDLKELLMLDADSDYDTDTFEKDPAYIDIYELITE